MGKESNVLLEMERTSKLLFSPFKYDCNGRTLPVSPDSLLTHGTEPGGRIREEWISGIPGPQVLLKTAEMRREGAPSGF